MVFDGFSLGALKDWASLSEHSLYQHNTSLFALTGTNVDRFVELGVGDLPGSLVFHLCKNEVDIGRSQLFGDYFAIFTKFSENLAVHLS